MLTKAQIRRRLKAIVAPLYRIGLRNRDFSIISNNCWGGAVYDRYRLEYKSPTIGLWFPPEDYIRFLNDIEHYLNCRLTQINWKECHAAEILAARKASGKYKFELDDMIIGRLDDVDIIFLHYKSFKDAENKWNKRKQRINFNNLVVKFNDQNGFEPRHFELFLKLPYKNKLFITAQKVCGGGYDCTVFVDYPDKDGSIMDDTDLGRMPFSLKKYFNTIH